MARLKLELAWQDVARLLGVQNPNNPNETLSPEISDAVIGIFAERYLKGIAQETVVQRAVTSVNAHVDAEIEKVIGEWKKVSTYPERYKYEPTENLKRALDVVIAQKKETILKELTPFINEQVDMKMAEFERTTQKRIFERIARFENELETMLSGVKETTIRKEMESRVQKIIGGLSGT